MCTTSSKMLSSIVPFLFLVAIFMTATTALKLQPSFASKNKLSAEDLDPLTRFSALYHTIHQELNENELPDASDETFDLSSYTPFCSNTTHRKPPRKSDKTHECIRWEEQELDMLMMYMDLLAVGMKRSLAQQFYRQIRCLSRQNTVTDPKTLTWSVCFNYDFSKHVGTLLAHYIKQDFKLKSPVAEQLKKEKRNQLLEGTSTLRNSILTSEVENEPKTSSKYLFMSNDVSPNEDNRGLYLLLAFANANTFRLFSSYSSSQTSPEALLHNFQQQEQTSCCGGCPDEENYFVNIEQDQCALNPFGRHCCHKACKSLARLRVGVSSSISYCCSNSNPTPCKQL